ncbi:Uma2 family endonuclease [Pseudanabaena sp. FACHB-2040]|uniref:Uma2 family endonuclease n=1 Tax=Pseudanabaena sp. FACHB-2040 TaxID=2692859 RepID=UPI0016825E88|nr:Uma2 family endonuclease [Pseudanabaena sp. FACHB-2040]MBD2257162.1 Uma2 family endonuclease [Pseudanabaena sp. FACHB-2040]
MALATDRSTQPLPLSFDDFLAHYGDDARYELIDGELFDLEPTGPHEEVAAVIARWLNYEIIQQGFDYFIPHRCLIKPLATGTGFRPDVIVLNRSALPQEPLWASQPVVTLGSTIKFVAEVVSSNWQNDYARKFEDYALLGIPEYWIADYQGLGGEFFIGRPKQPTLTVCVLNEEGRYERQILRGDQPIVSAVFPKLTLTAEAVLGAGR